MYISGGKVSGPGCTVRSPKDISAFKVWTGVMGNSPSKTPPAFARLMAGRCDVSAQQWTDFSHRMSKRDTIWPPVGSTSTKMLRGLMERQAGCHPKSDETLLQHIAQLLQERDAKTRTQAAARTSKAVNRKPNYDMNTTTDSSDIEDVYVAQGAGGLGPQESPPGQAEAGAAAGTDTHKREATDIQDELSALRTKLAELDHYENYLSKLIKAGRGDARDVRQQIKHLNQQLVDSHAAARLQVLMRTIPIGEGTAVRQMHWTVTPAEIIALKQGIPALCTLLAHFQRVASDKASHSNARRRQAPARTVPAAPPAYQAGLSQSQPPAYQPGELKLAQPPQSRQPSLSPALDDMRNVCFACGQPGHWRQDCPTRFSKARGRGRPARGRPT